MQNSLSDVQIRLQACSAVACNIQAFNMSRGDRRYNDQAELAKGVPLTVLSLLLSLQTSVPVSILRSSISAAA